MSSNIPQPLTKVHRFLDEAGDTTFFGKGRMPILGREGVSLSFGLGMVKFAVPAAEVRNQIEALSLAVEQDDYLKGIPSVVKRVQSGGFFFHSKDDPPEVRERMFKWIRGTDCSLEMVVDLYDSSRYEGSRNYYTPRRPLTAENKLGPPVS